MMPGAARRARSLAPGELCLTAASILVLPRSAGLFQKTRARARADPACSRGNSGSRRANGSVPASALDGRAPAIKESAMTLSLAASFYLQRIFIDGTTGDDTLNFSVNQFGAPTLSPFGVQYYSNGGNDNITGTWHDDVFVLNSGTETINGNGGHDAVSYSGSPTGVVVNLNQVTQHGGWAEGDQLTNIQNVTGSQENDVLLAKASGSVI